MDFKSLLNNSSQNFDALNKKIDDMASGYSNPEADKYWQPTVGPDGTGSATIRFIFLENKDNGVTVPYDRIWSHAFQGPTGKWYIENCLSTIGKDDPVNEYNSELWNTGTEENKEIVRKQKRKLSYIANIYVVDDPGNPENNGKVFLYKFGQKIFEKIKEKAQPEFEDEEKVNVFDFINGANFRLRIRKVAGFRNYDKSSFDEPSPLLDGDPDALKEVWEKQYSVSEQVSEKHFKSYDELKAKMNAVLGLSPSGAKKSAMDRAEEENGLDDDLDLSNMTSEKEAAPKEEPSASSDDDDEDMEFFRKLASGE